MSDRKVVIARLSEGGELCQDSFIRVAVLLRADGWAG